MKLASQTTAAVSEFSRIQQNSNYKKGNADVVNLAVVAIGARSTEFTVFEQQPNTGDLKLLQAIGRAEFGGEDFTESLTNYCMKHFIKAANSDEISFIWTDLHRECEILKQKLTCTSYNLKAR